ncbi:hypothetical protein NHF46_14605 [Arthrobacter alpinus]|nr:hypothetical protein [Arthrobacter alpinus]
MVQEGLTNVIKHAGPNVQSTVHLTWNARGLDITVHDDGRGATAALSTNPVPNCPRGPLDLPRVKERRRPSLRWAVHQNAAP